MDHIRQNVIDWNKEQLKTASDERDQKRFASNIAELLKPTK